MNLVMDRWIPVIDREGARRLIAPDEIVNPDIVDIAAPRPDFQGALYQFLIGLLQTAFAPADLSEWEQYWLTPPDAEQLSVVFSNLKSAFELVSNTGKPAFLQDLNMPEGEEKSIAALLIEAPGGKTLKDNLAHFVKGGAPTCACESCAATALFTLQANAPAGGVGHRVGLRGGGPLTTLILPIDQSSSVWQKLWLNVLTEEELGAEKISVPLSEVFPWTAPTHLSDKTGSATLPQDTHSLQMYWGMPRRIRLQQSSFEGQCDLCGAGSPSLFTHFLTKNYGVNYEGPWVHPLTPYRLDSKNEKPPLSLKGQQGGLGYRHWLALNWLDTSSGDTAAANVTSFNAEKYLLIGGIKAGLWCFGYDMDNMKARCWYESHMPVLKIPEKYQKEAIHHINRLIESAREVLKELRTQVKAAWFSRPKDVKGDTSMIDSSFWQATEPGFYRQLHAMACQFEELRFMPADVAKEWAQHLRKQAEELFDYWALEGETETMDMKRVMKARRMLQSKLKTLKPLAELDKISQTEKEVA